MASATAANPAKQRNKEETKHRGVYEKVPGSGVWWIRYFEGRDKHREKVGRKSDAIKLYGVRKAEILAGAKLPKNMRSKGEQISVVVDRAITWYEEHRPKSCRTAVAHLKLIKEELGEAVASGVTAEDIDLWISSHGDWSPATKNRYKTTFGKALQLELITGRLKVNVARLVAARKEDNTRVRWLTPEEEERVVKAIKARCPEYLPSFYIAYHTGMRQGEQYSLEWHEVSLKRRRVFLDLTKTGSDREVPMSQTCFDAFTELWERRKSREADGKPVNEWVFHSARYEEERLLNPRQWFEDVLKDANVKDFHWHDLRHTFCSRLVMRGIDLLTVSKLAGHQNVSSTTRYAHLSPKYLANAVEVLDLPASEHEKE
jgi:site-specific recombinase XerD